jgi:hypothetical protein
MVMSAKHAYSSSVGYAMRYRCARILSAPSKKRVADCVHHSTAAVPSAAPAVGVEIGSR